MEREFEHGSLMKSRKLLFAISLSAMAAGCVSGPGGTGEFVAPVPATNKEQAKLAPDIQKILAAGGLDPANPSAVSAPVNTEDSAVALALAQDPAPVPVKSTKPITSSAVTHAKPSRPERTAGPVLQPTQVAKSERPAERSVTRF